MKTKKKNYKIYQVEHDGVNYKNAVINQNEFPEWIKNTYTRELKRFDGYEDPFCLVDQLYDLLLDNFEQDDFLIVAHSIFKEYQTLLLHATGNHREFVQLSYKQSQLMPLHSSNSSANTLYIMFRNPEQKITAELSNMFGVFEARETNYDEIPF